jgi:hypothetical protein
MSSTEKTTTPAVKGPAIATAILEEHAFGTVGVGPWDTEEPPLR